MPIQNFHCSKCESDIEDMFYKYDTMKSNKLVCPECTSVGTLEIRHTPMNIGYNFQRTSLSGAGTPNSFKEVLGAIKNGVSKGSAGENISKY